MLRSAHYQKPRGKPTALHVVFFYQTKQTWSYTFASECKKQRGPKLTQVKAHEYCDGEDQRARILLSCQEKQANHKWILHSATSHWYVYIQTDNIVKYSNYARNSNSHTNLTNVL